MTVRQKMKGLQAIIPAAGESRRMGSPKMLLPYKGMTVIEKVIENVLSAGITDPLIVLGADREEIQEVIRGCPVTHCYNERYKDGMLSSVQCGFNSLPQDCRAVLVIPGDMPMIGATEIVRVIDKFCESGKGIVMPEHNGKRGHPLMIDIKYRSEVLSLPPDKGLRELALRHPADVTVVATDDPAVLRDLDTVQDYQYELKLTDRYGRDNPVQTEQQGDGAGH